MFALRGPIFRKEHVPRQWSGNGLFKHGTCPIRQRHLQGHIHLGNQGTRCPGLSCSATEMSSGGSDPVSEAERLTTEFMKFVAETANEWPAVNPSPTALLPPTAVVKAQMDALMRNDWPDVNNGFHTAFKFALPECANQMIVGDPITRPVRTWEAAERYLTMGEFETLFKQPSYLPLVNCDSWEFCSPLTFHRTGDENALQAVRVRFCQRNEVGDECLRERVYTFILQKVVSGPYKGCWMVVGVRLGDYANV